jgi:hypothetical protein
MNHRAIILIACAWVLWQTIEKDVHQVHELLRAAETTSEALRAVVGNGNGDGRV